MPARLQCPDDGAPLTAIQHHGIEVDLCSSCGGVWLDEGELERIVWRRRALTAAEHTFDVAELGVDIARGPESLRGIEDAAGDAISAALEFLGELFSGF